jgi:hypothetical protein
MKPLEKLKSILGHEYESEDGELYKVNLLSGMSEQEIDEFKKLLPNNFLPIEVEELLKFSRGFEYYGLEEVRFDSFGDFGFEEMFPYSVQLAGDGFGNFWILDVDSKGNWSEVYYVCHDPAVVVKHSQSLSEFIGHVDEFGKKGSDSNLDTIHEKTVMDIWTSKVGIMEENERDYNFPNSIKNQLPEMFLVADLEHEPIKIGFAWGKYEANSKIIRVGDKPIWVVEKVLNRGF